MSIKNELMSIILKFLKLSEKDPEILKQLQEVLLTSLASLTVSIAFDGGKNGECDKTFINATVKLFEILILEMQDILLKNIQNDIKKNSIH